VLTEPLFVSDAQAPKSVGELPTQVGNKTECALLGFVIDLGEDYRSIRAKHPDTTFSKVIYYAPLASSIIGPLTLTRRCSRSTRRASQ